MIPNYEIEEKTPQEQNCIRKESFLNQITILEPSLQSQLTAQIWTTSV